ncbi:MAG: CpsD/CapB family tyrosine-protein kinase [Clostridiales bacterium]|nr:CpsD/CapB family tyrosine-protein kinase [Clostridiales bacterium]
MSIFNRSDYKIRKRLKNSNSNRIEYLLSDNVSFDVLESFRNFKSSLTVSIPKKQSGEGTVIVMTSACPEDGKTTVAVNLAMTFAFSDAKVLLVDADIRKGRIARFFRRKSAPGLADYLSGQISLEDAIHQYKENENLSYLTCGTHAPRPFELLESEQMTKFIEEVKTRFDYIIIDTPPLLVVSDAIALATQADGTVLVTRYEMSYVSDIAKTMEKLNFAKANVLGVVVNDYTANEKTYYHSDKYRYKYYSYAYSSESDKDEKEKSNKE